MKPPPKKSADLASPRLQRNWDWRAAGNFMAGGAGGGLLLGAAIAGAGANATRAALLLGMALIAAGLTCVWFEIGRPWRAANVYRHIATSWMTREAVVALLLFASGAWALYSLAAPFVALAGGLGLVFLYSQARMLAANKGIPAWRHPRCVALMASASVAEGAGLLACIAAAVGPVGLWSSIGVIAVIAVRAVCWKRYLGGLTAAGAPEGSLRVLAGIDRRFLLLGHALPALLAIPALVGTAGARLSMFVAGLLLLASGWTVKYILIRRAAFTQGAALPHLPVRGRGPAGAAAKPGWSAVPGSRNA
ncbi:MAG: dimethyl sulfoxide reductase anchor subunit [Ramlibacter sp.]|nr:dimethyl sulfoxide reductase anchor subunit [Ramlibacter sp.]